MKIINNQQVIDIINNQLEEWEEDWGGFGITTLTRLVSGVELPNENKVSYDFYDKITRIQDHPIAYESTDDGAQGRTHFMYADDGTIIEIYDAMSNYSTIAIYNK
tara:strand:- start:16826 stop:17140 length:315 start_codon:yes stop_codon:yes gene_type:complete